MADPPSVLDSLTKAGIKPAQPTMARFFAQHPGLKDEVLAASQAGFFWSQIAKQIQADYGYLPDPANLHKFVENS